MATAEDTLHLQTLAVHAGAEPDAATGAMSPPLHLATTFLHGPAGERIGGYEYQREGNPTQDRLEQALAALEGGAAALAFASGMAAMSHTLRRGLDGVSAHTSVVGTCRAAWTAPRSAMSTVTASIPRCGRNSRARVRKPV